MPKKEEKIPVKGFKLTTKEIILVALIVLLFFYLSIVNSNLKSQIKVLKNEIGELSSVVSGDEQNEEFFSLSEEVALLRANIFSCSTDQSCTNIFKDKGYSCLGSLSPKCEAKMCICK